MAASELRLVVHNHNDFPGCYAVRLESDGRLLAICRNVPKVALARAIEEGLASKGTIVTLLSSSGLSQATMVVGAPVSYEELLAGEEGIAAAIATAPMPQPLPKAKSASPFKRK